MKNMKENRRYEFRVHDNTWMSNKDISWVSDKEGLTKIEWILCEVWMFTCKFIASKKKSDKWQK